MNATSEFCCLLETQENTLDFAAKLAGLCKEGDCLLLYGDVGSGKTTFARGFIRQVADTAEEIVSPTFTLLQTYPAKGSTVWHYDLYRLKNSGELLELGLDDAFNSGITLIEWPGVAASILPDNSLNIRLSIAGPGRVVKCSGARAAWQDRLGKLQNWWENR